MTKVMRVTCRLLSTFLQLHSELCGLWDWQWRTTTDRNKTVALKKMNPWIHPSIHPPSTPSAYLGFHWEQAKLGSLDSPLSSHTLKLLLGAPLDFFSQMRCMFNPPCRFRAYRKHSSQLDMSVWFQKGATWRHSDQALVPWWGLEIVNMAFTLKFNIIMPSPPCAAPNWPQG